VVKVVGTEYKISVPFACYQSPVVKGT
jgi:hypothetical protein